MIKKDLFNNIYNPDVLSCLANLSNDEVFTSPEVVNKMLDMLPKELFENKNTKFLDPCCKSGVFLREIAKRLINGLKNKIPNLQDRVDHIFKNQLYGIAITELTSLLSRRSLYCSKNAISKYSITKFNSENGNIRFEKIKHTWKDGKCVFCGASENTLNRNEDLETHAYEFIHKVDPKEIIKMKFDVIIGNPPYHLRTAKLEEQQNATPIYQLFYFSALKLKPRFISMIIPSRWMTGGKSSLESFREDMISNHHIKVMHDFANASECFSGVEIKGGVCYFLRDECYEGKCDYYLHSNNEIYNSKRYLDEFNIGLVIRDNRSLNIIKKVIESKDFVSFEKYVGSQTPFGLVSSFNDIKKEKSAEYSLKIYGKKVVGFTKPSYVQKNKEWINKFKVLAPEAIGNGDIAKDKIKPILAEKGSICSQTYIIYGKFDTLEKANHLMNYMKTKFFHFMLGQIKNTHHTPPSVFRLVPTLDFNEDWNDEKLFKKYLLTKDEINFINSVVWPEKK